MPFTTASFSLPPTGHKRDIVDSRANTCCRTLDSICSHLPVLYPFYKLELRTQFPALNDEKYLPSGKIDIS